jgi:hypothetical protein
MEPLCQFVISSPPEGERQRARKGDGEIGAVYQGYRPTTGQGVSVRLTCGISQYVKRKSIGSIYTKWCVFLCGARYVGEIKKPAYSTGFLGLPLDIFSFTSRVRGRPRMSGPGSSGRRVPQPLQRGCLSAVSKRWPHLAHLMMRRSAGSRFTPGMLPPYWLYWLCVDTPTCRL